MNSSILRLGAVYVSHFSEFFNLDAGRRRAAHNKRFVAIVTILFGSFLSFKGFSQTYTTSGTYTVPAGVTSITVECWGGGGRGGSVNGGNGGGGGGGGAYARKVFTGLTPGTQFTYTVGAGGNATNQDGQDSWFSSALIVMAKGGIRGNNGGAGGAGGLGTGTSIGDVIFAGGAGGNSTTNGGGAGGSSAGTAAAGNTGANAAGNGGNTAVTTAPSGGGNGGRGNSSTNSLGNGNGNGASGSIPGGGGGGSDDGTGDVGGNGAGGQIVVSYTLPDVTNFSVSSIEACAGSGAMVTISSSSLVTDTYTITYNVTGTLNSVASADVSVSFTAGTPGTATFTTAGLGSAENDVLRITRITNSAGNFVNLTNNTNFTVYGCRSWYSYQTGNYNNPGTWTLDPSGTTFDNPLNLIPSLEDDITILNGLTVTCNVDNQVLESTTIQAGGILDLANSTGHDLGTITGTGVMRIRGTALPAGNFTDFVATTGGTIEYYDVGGTLSTTQTEYNKLKMTNSTGAGITYTLAGNLTVNGNFDLSTTGAGTVTWLINNTSNAQRTMTLYGDLTVSTGGRIRAGTGNAAGNAHNLTMFGNFINNGIVQFFDPTTAPFTSAYTSTTVLLANLRGNAVNVTFSGTANQLVTCNNQTDFYRFIVNKGIGQQPMVIVNSSAASNLRLFGPANRSSTNNDDFDDQVGYSDCALSIINGTLQLTGTLTIPTLVEDGPEAGGQDYFKIPQTAALWLNSPGVNVTLTSNINGNDDQRLMVNGLFRVSNGSTFHAGFSRGIGAGSGGSTLIEGTNTTVTAWQYRPLSGGTEIIAFTQTGGTFNVGYGYAADGGVIDGISGGYARFDLNSANSSFTMTNGVMNVAKATNAGGFIVGSSAGNYSVTGGTINLYIGEDDDPDDGADIDIFNIRSTAPLYNVNIHRESGTAIARLITNNLVVQNNLTLVDGTLDPTFNCNSLNLTVGGNFEIQTGTVFTLGVDGTTNNVLTFNGAGAQTWTQNGTINNLTNVVVNKTSGTLTLAGANTFPNITDTFTGLTLTSGTLNDGGKTLTVTGAISNSATHTGTGAIVVNGPVTIGGADGTFGNLTIQTNNTVATSGNQTVTGTLRLVNGSTTLNIGSYALTVLENIYSDAAPGTAVAFNATKRIQTSGLYNAGGVTRQGAAGDLLFPLGTGARYTPNTINVAATTHGRITVRPVNSEHPNVTTPGQSLQYFWRVTSSGYSGVTAVTHKDYTFSTVTRSGTATQQQNYQPARFDADVNVLKWATGAVYNSTAAPNTDNIPDFNTGDAAWSGLVIPEDKLDGEYTCGYIDAFGLVQAYYSKGNGVWNALTGVWTGSSTHSGADLAGPPCDRCPVIIGDGVSINHIVTIDASNRRCGTLAINTGSTLDCGTNTGLNFGTTTGGAVSGRGTLRVAAAVFPTGDFVNFIGPNGGTVEWYGNSKTIPATYLGPGSVSLNLATYYNLVINPNASNTITLPASGLTVYSNVVQGNTAGFTGTVLTNGSRVISIAGDLAILRGTFNFSNANPSVTTLTVEGNTTVSTGAAMAVVAGGTANTNTLSTPGSITNNGTLDLRNTSVVNITFTGTSDVTLGGSGTTTLNLVTVNKGTNQTPAVTLNASGTVNTFPVAGGWLVLQNGTFDFAHTGTFNTTLSTNSYTIPATAKLKVSGSNVTLNSTSTDNSANDLFLNGALELAGGTVNIGPATVNTNNVDIEYASAGMPSIAVSSGTLWVKSSVRRSTATLTGALVYNQTGGTVTVGGIASNNTRGVFEIDANTGSSFTLTGAAALNVQRQTTTTNCVTSFADVYINPLSSNVSATSTVTVGLPSATTQGNLRVYIVPAVGNFTIQNGATTNAQTVWLYADLILQGTLTVPSPSVLNAACPTPDANVTIAGNFNCSGTYNAGTNTTTFNGTGPQSATLSANTHFYNATVSKAAGTTLTLLGTAPTAPALNNLEILTGILDIGAIDLTVNRNITINSTQVGSGFVVVYSTSGVSNTITSSAGSFTNLSLAGTASSATVSVSGNLTLNGTLDFATTNRYLMIGGYALIFSNSASTVTGPGSTAFIRTNGVASDLGVIKNWGTGNGQTFTYPIGTSMNYTPVTFNLDVSSAGPLTVIPVNSAHLTHRQGTSDRILNYYWTVRRGSSLTASAWNNPAYSHTFSYPSALLSGTTGSLAAGYLDPNSNPLGWRTSTHGGDVATGIMRFVSSPATNIPPAGSYYDYSVGTIITLPNPIAPLYSRLNANVTNLGAGGSWSAAANWTTDADGDPDLNNPSSIVPNGVPAVILNGARINTDGNGRRTYRITIDGLLNNGAYTGHNLGPISGTGTFRSATNTFPAGDYTAFVASSGGTIEYEVNASNSPLTMNSVNLTTAPNTVTYNNLSIRLQGVASGVLTMTSDNMILNGNLNIPAGATLNNALNRNITIAGNWVNNGAYAAGTATVTFNGSAAQAITTASDFYNLTISKSGGNVTLNDPTSITGTLTLTNGHIISSAANPLQLGVTGATAGGSANSFVSGPMTKFVVSGQSFNFPTGSVAASRYRPAQLRAQGASETWTVEYVGNDPSAQSLPNEDFEAPLGAVSNFEYWMIARSGAATADVTLSYNTGSYRADVGNIGNLANLRVAHWDATDQRWEIPPGGGTFSQSGNNITGTVTVTGVTQFSPFTLASLDHDSPLPIELLYFKAKLDGNKVLLSWSTAGEKDNDFFTVEKTTDFEKFSPVGVVASQGNSRVQQTYSLVDNQPFGGKSYYRLKQTDLDGKFTYSDPVMIYYEGPENAWLEAYPNPFNGNEVSIEITGVKDVSAIPVIIYDQKGLVVYKTVIDGTGQAVLRHNLIFQTALSRGLYIIKAGNTLQLTRKIAVN